MALATGPGYGVLGLSDGKPLLGIDVLATARFLTEPLDTAPTSDGYRQERLPMAGL